MGVFFFDLKKSIGQENAVLADWSYAIQVKKVKSFGFHFKLVISTAYQHEIFEGMYSSKSQVKEFYQNRNCFQKACSIFCMFNSLFSLYSCLVFCFACYTPIKDYCAVPSLNTKCCFL